MAPAKKRTTRKAKKESWDKIGASIGKKLEEESKKDHCCKPNISHHAGSGCIYGLGFIGALIYYISTATSFWSGLLGVLKAFLWPGFLVYALLKFLGA
ncbi:MAG: hypothetical protein ACOC32_02980 [Nanoarchaeota archaeon]